MGKKPGRRVDDLKLKKQKKIQASEMIGNLPEGRLTTALTRGASLAYEDDRDLLDFLARDTVELRDRDL